MVGGFKTILVGIIVYILVGTLVTQLITGTSAADKIIQAVLTLVVGAAIVLGGLKLFGGKK